MWNNGVIACSHRHAGIFDVVLAVFDELRPLTTYFAADQLACSIVMPAYGLVEEAKAWFDHYWANRQWFNRAGEQLLSRVLLEGLTPDQASERLRRQPIVGTLDARVSWWSTKLRRMMSESEPHDDAANS
jgi:hypothetical protein